VRSRLAGIFLFVFVIFQHFTLVGVGTYELTLGTTSGLLLLFLLLRSTAYVATTVTWCVLIILSGAAVLFSGYTAGSAYATTAMLFLLSSAIVCSAFGAIRYQIVQSAAFKNAALLALIVVVGLSVLQVVFARLGSASFFNIFGTRQYYHEYNHLVGLVDFPRAQGFYLEPSYNAFVIGSIGVFLLTIRWRRKATLALVLTGIIASQSATAIILILGFLAIAVMKASVRVRLLALVATALLAVFSGTYLLIRVATITTEGSSAYYRILAPIEVMIDVLTYSPAGKPFGSVEETITGYNLFMAGIPATSLDNGFYVLIFYFGWAGIIAISALGLLVARAVFRKTEPADGMWIATTWLFGSLFFSGAIMTPEFGIITAVIIIAIRTERSDDRIGLHCATNTVHRHGDFSGSFRSCQNSGFPAATHQEILKPRRESRDRRWHATR